MKPEDFIGWALDPNRSIEEAYFAELVTEQGYDAWCTKHIKGWYRNWEERAEKHRKRRLNPAHRVQLEPQEVERAVLMLAEHNYLGLANSQERPVRDITGLRFFPQLRKLRIGCGEIVDLAPLTALPELEEFDLWDAVVEDLRPVAALKKLRRLLVSIKEPWPLVEGWSGLTELEFLWWNGNLLVLEGLGPFPKVKDARIGQGFTALPVRDLTRLPEMPVVERLEVGAVRRLDGVEKWPRLMELKLTGTFRDLTPLTQLPAVTHLEMWCDSRLNLEVLCRVPALRAFKLWSLQPQEWFGLTDAPHLHEVTTDRCEANAKEVAALQEVLPAWDADFLMPTARPLPALEFIVVDQEQWLQQHRGLPEEVTFWDGNQALIKAEWNWFLGRVQGALDQRLGRGWGKTEHMISVEQLEAAERLPEIITVIRELLATRRYPHRATLRIALVAPNLPKKPRPPESAESRLKEEIAEHKDWERRSKEEAELRERAHKLRQLQEEGVKVDPEEFEPEPEPPEVEELDADNETYADEDEGEPHLLADDYDLHAIVSEDRVVVHFRDVEVAERLMQRPAQRV